MSRLRKTLAIFAFSMAISSCGDPSVASITLARVDVVEADQIRDPGNALGDQLTPGMKPWTQVRITFSTHDDFQSIAYEKKYFIGQQVAYCSSNGLDEQRLLRDYGDLYDQKAMVSPTRPHEFGVSRIRNSKLVEYHFYFHPRKIYRDPKRESLDKQDEFIYDLVRDPKDICFKIDGGPSDSDSYSFHTNTVRVSKAQLIAAFSKAHLSCLDSERYCLRPSFAGDK